jgi:hypothetical protein
MKPFIFILVSLLSVAAFAPPAATGDAASIRSAGPAETVSGAGGETRGADRVSVAQAAGSSSTLPEAAEAEKEGESPALAPPLPPAEKPRRHPSGAAVITDLIIVRPIGLAACGIAMAGAIVALPLAAASGSTDTVRESLLEAPLEFTFTRPLGEYPRRY